MISVNVFSPTFVRSSSERINNPRIRNGEKNTALISTLLISTFDHQHLLAVLEKQFQSMDWGKDKPLLNRCRYVHWTRYDLKACQCMAAAEGRAKPWGTEQGMPREDPLANERIASRCKAFYSDVTSSQEGGLYVTPGRMWQNKIKKKGEKLRTLTHRGLSSTHDGRKRRGSCRVSVNDPIFRT